MCKLINYITGLNMKATGLFTIQFKYTTAKYRLVNIPACACFEKSLGVGEQKLVCMPA